MTREQAKLIVEDLKETIPLTDCPEWGEPFTFKDYIQDAERERPALGRAYRALLSMADGVEGP